MFRFVFVCVYLANKLYPQKERWFSPIILLSITLFLDLFLFPLLLPFFCFFFSFSQLHHDINTTTCKWHHCFLVVMSCSTRKIFGSERLFFRIPVISVNFCIISISRGPCDLAHTAALPLLHLWLSLPLVGAWLLTPVDKRRTFVDKRLRSRGCSCRNHQQLRLTHSDPIDVVIANDEHAENIVKFHKGPFRPPASI
jgi:hypothetical protein